MANYEATKYDFDGGNIQGLVGVSTGSVIPWGATGIPTGFLECDGSAVSRSTYSTLFGVIGTTYGAGDGSSTFNLPDLQDNVAIGKSGTKALASTGGANTVAASGTVGGSTANATLTTAQLASHTHEVQGQKQGTQNHASLSRYGGGSLITVATGSGQGHSHNMSATFTGSATSVVQPYLTTLYIIKT